MQAQVLSLLIGFLFGVETLTGPSTELPQRYFRLMEAELLQIEKQLATEGAADPKALKTSQLPGALLAAAVLYTRDHPANPGHGDPKKLALALKLGDLLATENEKGGFTQLLNHNWGTYFWLEAYRLLEKNLSTDRQARWSKELEKNVRNIVADSKPRVEFPRYQAPFLLTSTNHYSLWNSTAYLAGRVFRNREWEELGAKVMRRLAAEEQTPDGYWGELTDNGPDTGYNFLTLTGVALYWEYSRDPAALEALRRATDFHKYFTYPNGIPVETVDGRNRHFSVSWWGHFGFSHFPEGRRYAEFLASFLREGELEQESTSVAQGLGRIAQNALYYHEGPTARMPLDLPRFAHQMKAPAGIRKRGPWIVCLSGLTEPTFPRNPFFLDRQGHVSVFHEKLGPIVTGANSKRQPELATLWEKEKGQTYSFPLSGRLRMDDDADRLALAYRTFFAEVDVPSPSQDRLELLFTITETGKGRLEEARLTLQLAFHAGEVLETAQAHIVLGEKRIEFGADQIGGSIRHHGWSLQVDPSARLIWPIYPFNPYRNGPETDLRHAVAALSIPLAGKEPRAATLPWGSQKIKFVLDAKPEGTR